MMTYINDRILFPGLADRIVSADEAASLIGPGMVLGFSGFSHAGYPKAVPAAIARRGTAKDLKVLAGASTGPEVDTELSRAGLMSFRAPFMSDKYCREAINQGHIKYFDTHLSHMPKHVRRETFGKIDYAIIACTMITEDCGIVPQTTIGAADSIVEMAEKVILEINTHYPVAMRGIHDIFVRDENDILPITQPDQRIGVDAIPCTPDKIAAIVIIDDSKSDASYRDPDSVSQRIAYNIINFFKTEVVAGRLPETLAPLQSGQGNVANAVLAGLETSGFRGLNMYTEVLQDAALFLVKKGVLSTASTTALSLSEGGEDELFSNIDWYKERLIVRPQDITNNPEIIQRLGLIAMNTAMEIDIYGNVNSTHISGSKLMNGIGGSCDFSRNSRITIFMTPSTAKGGTISAIVPMVTHTDSTEHDVHVVVTEHGYADLRGKCPRDRAELIIENCCDPSYRPALREYYESAKKSAPGMHTPHDIREAFSWHIRCLETGTMQKQKR
jgi:succinyl-CoA:acetate CoA-transferase